MNVKTSPGYSTRTGKIRKKKTKEGIWDNHIGYYSSPGMQINVGKDASFAHITENHWMISTCIDELQGKEETKFLLINRIKCIPAVLFIIEGNSSYCVYQ